MIESARKHHKKRREEKGSNVPLLLLKDGESYIKAETLNSDDDDDLIQAPKVQGFDNLFQNFYDDQPLKTCSNLSILEQSNDSSHNIVQKLKPSRKKDEVSLDFSPDQAQPPSYSSGHEISSLNIGDPLHIEEVGEEVVKDYESLKKKNKRFMKA